MEVQQTDNLDKDSARQASHTVEPSTSRQEHVDWFELAAQGSVALTELAKGFINLHEQLCKDYSKIKILALKVCGIVEWFSWNRTRSPPALKPRFFCLSAF